MNSAFFFIIGVPLVFLGGKDPILMWLSSRKEGRSVKESAARIIPMFVLPWPRTVNKRLIWLAAGFFLIASGVSNLL